MSDIIESTICTMIAKGPEAVTGAARLTAGSFMSDPLWRLARNLVCSKKHTEGFHNGQTFIVTQVDYVSNILEERLVAWGEEMANREAVEANSVAYPGCPDVYITPPKNTSKGAPLDKMV